MRDGFVAGLRDVRGDGRIAQKPVDRRQAAQELRVGWCFHARGIMHRSSWFRQRAWTEGVVSHTFAKGGRKDGAPERSCLASSHARIGTRRNRGCVSCVLTCQEWFVMKTVVFTLLLAASACAV